MSETGIESVKKFLTASEKLLMQLKIFFFFFNKTWV